MNAQIMAFVREDHGPRGWKSAEAQVKENVLLKEDVRRVLDRTSSGAVTIETNTGQILNLSGLVASGLKI